MDFLIKPALAQVTNPALPQMGQGSGEVILGNLIGGLVGLFVLFGAMAALVFLGMGALQWITSGGDKNQLQAAQEKMTQAVVGLIILAAVFALTTVVYNFLGLGTSGPGGIDLPLPSLFSGSGSGNNPAPPIQRGTPF